MRSKSVSMVPRKECTNGPWELGSCLWERTGYPPWSVVSWRRFSLGAQDLHSCLWEVATFSRAPAWTLQPGNCFLSLFQECGWTPGTILQPCYQSRCVKPPVYFSEIHSFLYGPFAKRGKLPERCFWFEFASPTPSQASWQEKGSLALVVSTILAIGAKWSGFGDFV